MNYCAATDTGLLRSNNEDCYLSLADVGLWLVADGMGGHEAGEVASAIVADTVKTSAAAGVNLEQAIRDSHAAVLKAASEGKGAAGMGSTVIALHSQGQHYQVSWVGDSRAYLWTPDTSGGTLEQLSTDHSYVQLLLAAGAIGQAEAINHPDKNVITQCIGSQDVAQILVDSVKGEWQPKQWILLCSDGLTDELSDETIAQLLCDSQNVRDAVAKLMKHALTHGGRDNITLQIIESPLTHKTPLTLLQDWLPALVGHRYLDAALYATTLVCLLLLIFWLFA